MTELEKLQLINKWQSADCVHPLTCYDGTRLIPKIDESGVCVLECKKCGQIQTFIPDVVFNIDSIQVTMNEVMTTFEQHKKRQFEKDSSF